MYVLDLVVLFPAAGRRFACWFLSLCLKQWGLVNSKRSSAQKSCRSTFIVSRVSAEFFFEVNGWHHELRSHAPSSLDASCFLSAPRSAWRSTLAASTNTHEEHLMYICWQRILLRRHSNAHIYWQCTCFGARYISRAFLSLPRTVNQCSYAHGTSHMPFFKFTANMSLTRTHTDKIVWFLCLPIRFLSPVCLERRDQPYFLWFLRVNWDEDTHNVQR